MSLLRGIQSAIFHYVSCAPCTGYAYRKKRRKQAKKDMAEKKKLQLENPDIYEHPGPSMTNPHWEEEIRLGPGPPPRRARGKTSSRRGLTTAGTWSTVGSHASSSMELAMSNGHSSLRTSDDTLGGDNWNRRRYQREDEELWGFEELDLRSMPSRQRSLSGSSIGMPGASRPGTSYSGAESYYKPKVPPVNDLHPPIVSVPSTNKADNAWMLQPPPRAKVMNGKEKVSNRTRSRSGSGASTRIELSLQRQVSVRQMQKKLQRGGTPEIPTLSRGNSSRTRREDDVSGLQNMSTTSKRSRSKRPRNGHIEISEDPGSSSSEETVAHSGSNTPAISSLPSDLSVIVGESVRGRASRNKLSTILSSTYLSPETSSAENSDPSAPRPLFSREHSDTSQNSPTAGTINLKKRIPLVNSDESTLNTLQELVSPKELRNSRFVSSPLLEARVPLPPTGSTEELQLQGAPTGGCLGTVRNWAEDEEATIEVRPSRWSMDI